MRCQHGYFYTDSCIQCDEIRDGLLPRDKSHNPQPTARKCEPDTTFRGSYLSAAGYHVCYECAGHDGDHLPWCKTGQEEKAKEPVYFPPSRINEKPVLPRDSKERKAMPVAEGVLQYFGRAIAYVSKVSKAGNDQHNPGEALHWAKEKSFDHLSCVGRHLIDAGKRGDYGLRESGFLAWRALAALEVELEAAEARGEKW